MDGWLSTAGITVWRLTGRLERWEAIPPPWASLCGDSHGCQQNRRLALPQRVMVWWLTGLLRETYSWFYPVGVTGWRLAKWVDCSATERHSELVLRTASEIGDWLNPSGVIVRRLTGRSAGWAAILPSWESWCVTHMAASRMDSWLFPASVTVAWLTGLPARWTGGSAPSASPCGGQRDELMALQRRRHSDSALRAAREMGDWLNPYGVIGWRLTGLPARWEAGFPRRVSHCGGSQDCQQGGRMALPAGVEERHEQGGRAVSKGGRLAVLHGRSDMRYTEQRWRLAQAC